MILGLVLALGAPAGAEDPAPDVSLDDLLKLPSSSVGTYQMDKRGGATRDEWERRFTTARINVREARAALARSLEELDEAGGGGSWKMAPPGLGQIMQQQQGTQTGSTAQVDGPSNTPSPLAPGLSGDIRRQKLELKRAERALRDLEVEANLADVPESWRAQPARSPDG